MIFFERSPESHRGRHFGDVADLAGEVRGHGVHIVGEVLPGTADARYLRLTAELAFGSDFARNARHLGCEGVELVHHDVDGVLELEDLALHVDRDLLRQVALGDGSRHLGDVADLASKVAGHQVHAVGEVGPGAGDAFDLRLTAELALRTHFARYASDLRRKGVQLVHHALMVFLSSRISPFTSTVIFFERSPRATAVVTSAMLRTWPVRLVAIRFTLSVRSAQVPARPPPALARRVFLPVPTSRATRVTSEAKRVELVDHRVDGVLELEDLALHVDGDLLRQVAASDRGRDLGDVAHLARQVVGHQVHIVGEVGPGAGDARHLRLTAELALGADLARHAGHFGGEAVELVDHRVDGVLQLEDLAFHVDGDLLGKIAPGDGSGDLGDVADLAGQVVCHQVHVVGEVLPRAGNAFHARLAAELSFGTDLAGDAGHFRCEAVELVHHRVDGVLELEDLALHLDGDLLRQVAAGYGRGHLGDVADLTGQVGRHRVDIVGEVFPGAGNALHLRLAAQLSFSTHLAGDAGHFRREAVQLVDHRVDDLADAQELAAQRSAVDFNRHRLGKVALRDRANHAGDFGGRLDHVLNQVVDGANRAFPASASVLDASALADLSFLADNLGEPFELLRHLLVEGDHFVEDGGDLAVYAVNLFRQAHAEFAAA